MDTLYRKAPHDLVGFASGAEPSYPWRCGPGYCVTFPRPFDNRPHSESLREIPQATRAGFCLEGVAFQVHVEPPASRKKFSDRWGNIGRGRRDNRRLQQRPGKSAGLACYTFLPYDLLRYSQ